MAQHALKVISVVSPMFCARVAMTSLPIYSNERVSESGGMNLDTTERIRSTFRGRGRNGGGGVGKHVTGALAGATAGVPAGVAARVAAKVE